MGLHTAITSTVFEAFLRCETKAYLMLEGSTIGQSDIDDWRRICAERYKRVSSAMTYQRFPNEVAYHGMPSAHALRRGIYAVIIDPLIILPDLHAQPHALERAGSNQDATNAIYSPVRFLPAEKLTTADKLLVAFDALAVGRVAGKMPRAGKIIHGSDRKATTFALAEMLGTARSCLTRVAALRTATSPPRLSLNKHCPECEFQSRCRQIAIEADDLSLLTGVKEKDRKRLLDKGIFTINQLSYTFRPRRRSKRIPAQRLRHEPALKALAIRKKQIHIVGTPRLDVTGTPVYFDVEGVPDRDFYYLVGMGYRCGDDHICRSFWADDAAEERRMWLSCLETLRLVERPRLIHYGSYELKFLKNMIERYRHGEDGKTLVDHLLSSSLNLLSLIYNQVYFPTYSNGLKDIARHLGFRWSEPDASGLGALAWRTEWEASRRPDLKRKLLTYNAEDWEAAQRVTEALADLCTEQPATIPRPVSVNVASLEEGYPRRFGALQYALPDFKTINEAAYWDYQRSKVYARSGSRPSSTRRPKRISATKKTPVSKNLYLEGSRPDSCVKCGSNKLYKKWKVQSHRL